MDKLEEYVTNKYLFHKYCDCSRRLTTHIKLKKHKPVTGFIAGVVAAAITGFKADLTEPEYECLTCGKQT